MFLAPAQFRLLSLSAVFALLAGCSTTATPPQQIKRPSTEAKVCPAPQPCPVCPSCPPPTITPAPTAPAAALQSSSWSAIPGWKEDDLAAAWPALRESCSALGKREGWSHVCEIAGILGEHPGATAIRQFFETNFTPWQLTNPDHGVDGLITGYYEPLIKGSRTRSPQYSWPVYGVPSDMLTIELGDVYPELKNMRLRGRLVGNKVVPYWTRAELEENGRKPQARTLFWAADPIDLFFLQVQGSGRIQLPDGSYARVGYADQNGHPYQSIGRWLVDQGELPLEKASMDGIKRWAAAHPARLTELLNANPSYVFFRELPQREGGPIGAQGTQITAGRSLAVDPRYVPLGAPVFLATTYPLSEKPLQRLMVAQDTGGAIKGVVRADFFWGFGPEAGAQAGRMRQQGKMWVLLPNGMQAGER
nr:murein transglycosylase A [Azoarcus sp. TTM-91]